MTNPSRVAFALFGKDIYWYGILMAFGIVLAVLIAMSEEKRKKLPKDIVIDMCLVTIPAGVIGARLYYVLFDWQQYAANPIKILFIWEGGLAIYGAVIGGLLAVAIFSRVRKVRFLALADTIVPGLVLAQAIGRWGNFFNQEAYGLPVTPEMLAKYPILNYFPFSVSITIADYFNNELCTTCVTTASGGHLHLATFFYESAWCLLIFIFLMLMRKRFKHDGDAFAWYALLYSFERMFVEGLRGDSLWLIKPSEAGMTDGVRVSQLISAVVFLIVGAFLIIRAIREKKLGRLIWPSPLAAPEAEPADAEEDGAAKTPASKESVQTDLQKESADETEEKVDEDINKAVACDSEGDTEEGEAPGEDTAEKKKEE